MIIAKVRTENLLVWLCGSGEDDQKRALSSRGGMLRGLETVIESCVVTLGDQERFPKKGGHEAR